MNEPMIPSQPTEPIIPDEEEETEAEDKPKGGRPSNKELAADNKRLTSENERLRRALEPFAYIPDDPAKPDDAVLYVLSKGGEATKILARDLRAARKLR